MDKSNTMSESAEATKGDDDVNDAFLLLPKTGLRVFKGELQRLAKGGGVTMRIPLDKVEDVTHRFQFNPGSLVSLAFACGLAAIARFVSESNALSSGLYVAAGGLLCFALITLRSGFVVIRARDQNIDVLYIDLHDEAAGFALSVRELLQSPPARQQDQTQLPP
jgi:hypothetical protein